MGLKAATINLKIMKKMRSISWGLICILNVVISNLIQLIFKLKGIRVYITVSQLSEQTMMTVWCNYAQITAYL